MLTLFNSRTPMPNQAYRYLTRMTTLIALLAFVFQLPSAVPTQAAATATLRWTSPYYGSTSGGNSVTVADINGDGVADVILSNNYLQALNGVNGSVLWTYRDPSNRAYFGAAPSVADIGLGGKSIVAISGGTNAAASGTYILNSSGSLVRFIHFTPSDPCGGCTPATYDDNWNDPAAHPTADSYVFYPNASPSLGSITSDGSPSIVVTIPGLQDNPFQEHGFLMAYDNQGNVRSGFPLWTGQYMFSEAALADLDGDGVNDVFTTSDADRVLAMKGDGTLLRAFGDPTSITGSNYQMHPTAGDLNGDGVAEPMIMGWSKNDVRPIPNYWHPGLNVYDRSGRHAWGSTFEWNIPNGSAAINCTFDCTYVPQVAAAIVDADGDGAPEVYATGLDGRVHVLKANGSTLVESFTLAPPGGPSTSMLMAEPTIADVDGDGQPDIVVGVYNAANSGDKTSGGVYAWHLNGTAIGWLVQGFGVRAPVAVADTDGNGRADLVVWGIDGYVRDYDTAGLPCNDPNACWIQHHHDAAHTGRGWTYPGGTRPRIRSSVKSGNTAQLNWQADNSSGTIASFQIFRCLPRTSGGKCSSDGEFSSVASVGGSTSTWTDYSATSGEAFSYKVGAFNSASAPVGPRSPAYAAYAIQAQRLGPTGAPTDANLIANGGFEIVSAPLSGGEGVIFQDWEHPEYGSPANAPWGYPQVSTDAHSGAYALMLSGSGNTLDIAQPQVYYGYDTRVGGTQPPDTYITLNAGTTYELGFWVKTVAGSSNVHLALSHLVPPPHPTQWPYGGTTPSLDLFIITQDNCSTGGTWHYCKTTYTPNSSTNVVLNILITSGSGTVLIDDAQLLDTSVRTAVATATLQAGWNLVSLPALPQDATANVVFSPLVGRLDAAYAYLRPSCGTGGWVNLLSGNPMLSTDEGLWLHLNGSSSAQWPIYGTAIAAGGRHVTLCNGWSLVAYPGTAQDSASNAVGTLPVSQVNFLNLGNWLQWAKSKPAYVNTLNTLDPGKSYWVQATSSATWTHP